MSKDTSGQAFPAPLNEYGLGLTKREYFAGQALAGAMANIEYLNAAFKIKKVSVCSEVARSCYDFADAILRGDTDE